ncbi:MAG TPA: hypothetical protein VKE72_03880 [Methylocella sp.]|nr:hypothetical protein [Methylocella sp.]
MTKVDLNISSRQEIVSIIGQLLTGYPDPLNPPPPSRWDRLIVSALRRIFWVIPPGPNPQWRWQAITGPQPQPWVEVELNPQPLPARTLFFTAIAQEFIDRAQSIQETADAMASGEEQRGIIIVGGYVSKFADDFCGNGFRIKWPFPGPPPWWFSEEVSGLDLVVAGVQIERAVPETFGGALRQAFTDAGSKLLTTGLARLQ